MSLMLKANHNHTCKMPKLLFAALPLYFVIYIKSQHCNEFTQFNIATVESVFYINTLGLTN